MENSVATLDKKILQLIPAKVAGAWQVLPLGCRPDGTVMIAAVDPGNMEMLENLRTLIGAPVTVHAAWSAPQMTKALEESYGVGANAVADLNEGNEGSMVHFVDDLIRQARQANATDIHIEPFENELLIRFRVDGLLHTVPVPPGLVQYQSLLCSRIKIMADMNIAEKRLPQDGRIRFKDDGDGLDLRVSTVPTMHGESIDLRLLPKTRLALGLEELGMAADQRAAFATLIRKPNGIVLVTGPTGHGKTTTLYACLSRINTTDKKIIAIEDPVEVRLRGVNQIQVHSKIGLTFANGLRSILRQDPDVIMVGEVRDADTAEIAVRASLTGHLVFSTLHTNDAVGAITRLVDMGIEPYLVASSLHAVLAQRLVRLVCRDCKGAAAGCKECRHTGFKGRTGLFELLLINDEVRQLILDRASHVAIRKKAAESGMRTLLEDGRLKSIAGLTTMPEVLRVTEGIE